MRQNKIFIISAVLTLFSTHCLAESTTADNKDSRKEPINLVKTGKGAIAGRPKAPDRQVVTCAYDGEELHLSFVYSEGAATISVTDETFLTSTYVIDTTPLVVSVPVGELVGTVSIEMETENENSYTGIIE